MLPAQHGGRGATYSWTGVRAMTGGSGLARLLTAMSAIALVVCAAPALGKSGTQSRSFSTGAFAVYCTSSGQLCRPSEKLTFSLPRRGTLTSITYTTAATHCSGVVLHVLRNGHQIAKTPLLATGQRTARVVTHVRLPKGATTLGFQAQGFVGGCNVGRVLSWGGKVTVTVKLH